jgi:hypothetical protein
MTHHQKAGQSHNIANWSCGIMEKLKYMGMPVTNQNLICKKIKSRLNSENVCYHLVQNLLSSCLLSKTTNIQNYNLACIFVWLCNLVSYIERRTLGWECLRAECWGEYLDLYLLNWSISLLSLIRNTSERFWNAFLYTEILV